MRRLLFGAALALAGAVISGPSYATVWTVGSGNVGSFPDSNVINAACIGNITGPALEIQGCLNDSHTTLVDFTSDEILQFGAGGQAKIEAQTGTFNDLMINLDSGLTFQTLIINIEASDNGTVTFSSPGQSDVTLSLSQNGSNFFNISGADFSSISFNTDVGITEIDLVDDVKDVRIGVRGITDVPEPASLALMGAGLLGFGLLRRRKKA